LFLHFSHHKSLLTYSYQSPFSCIVSAVWHVHVTVPTSRCSLFTLKRMVTRSTVTVYTSAKARLTRVTIQIQIHDPDRHQNVIICSLAHFQPSLKISCKSVCKFLRKVANRQRQYVFIHYLFPANKLRCLSLLSITKCIYQSFTYYQNVVAVDYF